MTAPACLLPAVPPLDARARGISVASTPGTEGEELAGPQWVPGKEVGLGGWSSSPALRPSVGRTVPLCSGQMSPGGLLCNPEPFWVSPQWGCSEAEGGLVGEPRTEAHGGVTVFTAVLLGVSGSHWTSGASDCGARFRGRVRVGRVWRWKRKPWVLLGAVGMGQSSLGEPPSQPTQSG